MTISPQSSHCEHGLDPYFCSECLKFPPAEAKTSPHAPFLGAMDLLQKELNKATHQKSHQDYGKNISAVRDWIVKACPEVRIRKAVESEYGEHTSKPVGIAHVLRALHALDASEGEHRGFRILMKDGACFMGNPLHCFWDDLETDILETQGHETISFLASLIQ